MRQVQWLETQNTRKLKRTSEKFTLNAFTAIPWVRRCPCHRSFSKRTVSSWRRKSAQHQLHLPSPPRRLCCPGFLYLPWPRSAPSFREIPQVPGNLSLPQAKTSVGLRGARDFRVFPACHSTLAYRAFLQHTDEWNPENHEIKIHSSGTSFQIIIVSPFMKPISSKFQRINKIFSKNIWRQLFDIS